MIVYAADDARYGTDEHHLLDEMADTPADTRCAETVAQGDGYDVYHILRDHC